MSAYRKVTGHFPGPIFKRSGVIKKIKQEILTTEEVEAAQFHKPLDYQSILIPYYRE